MNFRTAVLLVLAAAATSGCSLFKRVGLAPNEADPTAVAKAEAATPDEPAHVVVQHVLISFEETHVPGATRTKEQARVLAQHVLDDARSGREFGELVRLYSDDRTGDGKIALANYGVVTNADEGERRKMVRGFGAVAFTLEVGAVGLVDYDANSSPYGWHVVKRLK